MNLKAKVIVLAQKTANQEKLTARMAVLKEKGLDEKAIEKDGVVKKIKADIRHAVRRLNSVATHEALLTAKKEAKEGKTTKAPTEDAEKPKKTKAKKEAAAK